MLKRVFHTLWILSLSLLVLVAVALTAARLWSPELSAYRIEIEQGASKALNKQVSIGRMEVGWRGLSPVIKLKDVELSDPEGTHAPIAIREIWLTVDAEQSLSRQLVTLSGINVIGTELTLVRDAGGQFYIDGLRPENDDGKLLAELLRMSLSIHDVNVTFIDEQSGHAPWRFASISLSMRNQGSMHTLTGHALLPADIGYRADIEGVLHGYAARLRDWRGKLYIQGQSVSLSGALGQLLAQDQTLQGVADLRLWLDIGSIGIASVSGEIDTEGLEVGRQDATGSYTFTADSLTGQFGWRRRQGGWQFAIQNMIVRQQQGRWETPNMSLAVRQQEDAMAISGVSPLVVLDGVGALLPLVPGLTVEQRQLLGGLQPRGSVKDLVFSITSQDGDTRVNDFSARFSGLSIEQSGVFPTLVGLDGTLRGDMESGTLTLTSQNAGVNDERLFRELIPIDVARGDIRWQLHDDFMEIGTDALEVRNKDISLLASMGLYLPVGDGAAAINLEIDIKTADVGRTHHYLPAKIMSPRAVAWLDRSLKRGTVTDGRLVLNGRFDQIPFDKGGGVLKVHLPVTDALLDFHKGWSPVTGLDAMIDIKGRALDIISSRGAIRGAALDTVHARIKNLAHPTLTVKGDVQGPLPVMLAELGSSPLGNTYGGFVDRVTTAGAAKLGLDLVIPLVKGGPPPEIAGRADLHNNALKVNDSKIELRRISGRLEFDSHGVKGDKLQAHLFGHPATARVWTEPGKHVTRISLDGPLRLIDRYIDKDSFLGIATSGSSDWRVLVTIRGLPERGKKADVGVTVTSDLVGTVIDLPAPFGKPGNTERKLTIVADKVTEEEKRLQLNYGDLVEGVLIIAPAAQGYQLQRGALAVNGKPPALPDSQELLFSGRLPHFRLTEWQPYLGGGEGGGLPLVFAMTIDDLEVLGYQLKDVSASMRSEGAHQSIRVSGPDASGDIMLVHSAAGLDKVSVNLERLALAPPPEQESSTGPGYTPANFPDLQMIVQQFVYAGTDLGLLEIKAARQPDNGYRIERALLSSDLLDARLVGNWRLAGNEQQTRVDLDVSKGEMDRLMKLFGYQKTIDRGIVSGTLRAAWPGPPWAFSPPIAEGKVNIRITDGQLLDLKPGAAGRVLGLISLNNLPRRLSLDFTDIFAEGFSFDEISGSFVVDDGNAYTNDLTIDGPAAKIEISGRIGIADQDYDELVTVIPYVKTGIPLAGTLVGGPAVGAVLLVAETLLEGKLGPLNRIAEKQYSVTGPWENPVIEKLQQEVPELNPELTYELD